MVLESMHPIRVEFARIAKMTRQQRCLTFSDCVEYSSSSSPFEYKSAASTRCKQDPRVTIASLMKDSSCELSVATMNSLLHFSKESCMDSISFTY